VLCARPLHYHSMPDHLYWREEAARPSAVAARPRVAGIEAVDKRSFRIRYAWDVEDAVAGTWRAFVHFGTRKDILFQDDHDLTPPVGTWKQGQRVEIGPREVSVPASVRARSVNVYIGLFDPGAIGTRARLPGSDGQRRVLAGRLVLKPELKFEPASGAETVDRSCFTRSDGGWAEGLHPTDVFLKNTQAVLGPLHAATAFVRLTRLEFLTPDGSVRRARYGSGRDATTVVVNFGAKAAEATSRYGGQVELPPWGFVVDAEGFAAFYATRWGGREYAKGALFTVRPADGLRLSKATKLSIFHAFGDAGLTWRGREVRVAKEETVAVSRGGRWGRPSGSDRTPEP